MNIESFGGILLEKLSKIELNDETFTDYIIGILSDETVENSEKYEIISEFLMDASVNSLVKEIIDSWEAWSEKMKIYKEEERLAQLELEAKEKKILELKKLEQEERKKREQLLAKYSYDFDEIVENEDGEAEINRNRDVVKDEERMRREEMQKKHEFEKERNRKLLEKQKLDEEKKKKKTMKKEKTRF
nr:9882_t:CDS:2 [Entrophospora candida]